MQLTISGAYGRDYTSKKAIEADWNAGKDFVVRGFGPSQGRYVNLADAQETGVTSVSVRYQQDHKVCVIKVPPKSKAQKWVDDHLEVVHVK